jgi:hypothetical protein
MERNTKLAYFVWTKMQVESGFPLPQTLFFKEMERQAGDGVFWWGVGNAVDRNLVQQEAENARGSLPVLFSLMVSRPKRIDVRPGHVSLWTQWEDSDGKLHDLPAHVLEFSGGKKQKNFHYALVCHSPVPLALGSLLFDPRCCKTCRDKDVGAKMVTALLKGDPEDPRHSLGIYHFGMRATLVKPWFVKLITPRLLEPAEMQMDVWKSAWQEFVHQLKIKDVKPDPLLERDPRI